MADSTTSETQGRIEEIATQLGRIALLMGKQAINQIPDASQKDQIALLDAVGFSNAEIARLVGATEPTVRGARSRLKR